MIIIIINQSLFPLCFLVVVVVVWKCCVHTYKILVIMMKMMFKIERERKSERERKKERERDYDDEENNDEIKRFFLFFFSSFFVFQRFRD